MEEEKFKPKDIGFKRIVTEDEFAIYSINGYNVITMDNEMYCFCTYHFHAIDGEVMYELFDKYRSLEGIIKVTEFLLKSSF